MCEWFDQQSKTVKIVLMILIGGLISGLYRIFTYLKSKDTTTLLFGILNFFGLGLVLVIVDLITIIQDDKITWFCK